MKGGHPSRVAGRGAILRSLRLLLRRVENYGECRASTPELQRWAIRLHTDLDGAFAAALSADGARAELGRYDYRRQISQKVPIHLPDSRGASQRMTWAHQAEIGGRQRAVFRGKFRKS